MFNLALKLVKKIFLASLAPFKYLYYLKENILVLSSVRHICGPRIINSAEDEAIVTCVVRNGASYIEEFVNYYLALGAKHIVFLDNNSEDDFILKACGHESVTVLSSKVSICKPYHFYREVVLKRYLLRRFCRNRWCISVDIDELFDYPFSGTVKLTKLIRYLDSHSYTAVVTQMLDMFSDRPLSELKDDKSDFKPSSYCYYDISDIVKYEYFACFGRRSFKESRLANPGIKVYKGGIRKKVFGVDSNCLTKHSLVFGERARMITPHFTSNVRCADFSAVCYHYKFTGSFLQVAASYVKSGYAWVHEYSAIVSRYRENPDIVFKQATARELKSVDDLIDSGFLVVSPQYRAFAKEAQR